MLFGKMAGNTSQMETANKNRTLLGGYYGRVLNETQN